MQVTTKYCARNALFSLPIFQRIAAKAFLGFDVASSRLLFSGNFGTVAARCLVLGIGSITSPLSINNLIESNKLADLWRTIFALFC